jgi:hypothetical protein
MATTMDFWNSRVERAPLAELRDLQAQGFAVSVTEVLAVSMEDVPGGLFRVADTLGKAGVNVDYAYGFVTRADLVLLILRVDYVTAALKVLRAAGVRLVDAAEIQGID